MTRAQCAVCTVPADVLDGGVGGEHSRTGANGRLESGSCSIGGRVGGAGRAEDRDKLRTPASPGRHMFCIVIVPRVSRCIGIGEREPNGSTHMRGHLPCPTRQPWDDTTQCTGTVDDRVPNLRHSIHCQGPSHLSGIGFGLAPADLAPSGLSRHLVPPANSGRVPPGWPLPPRRQSPHG